MTTARSPKPGLSRVLPTHFDDTARRARPSATPRKPLSELPLRFWRGELSLLHACCIQLGLSLPMLALTKLILQHARDTLPSIASPLLLIATWTLACLLARGTWASARAQRGQHGGAWHALARAALLCELLVIYPWACAAEWMLVPEQLRSLIASAEPAATEQDP